MLSRRAFLGACFLLLPSAPAFSAEQYHGPVCVVIDRKVFFDKVRKSLFGGRLTREQVAGMNAKLDEWERCGQTDLRWLAYMLATSFHETGRRMVPVEEKGKGRGKKYGKPDGPHGHRYYGRGDVQLTWYENYQKMGELLGIPLAEKPELALDPEISMRIMFEGMKRGTFTNHNLAMYFSDQKEDWVRARRIINRMDRAKTIANIGKQFHAALTA